MKALSGKGFPRSVHWNCGPTLNPTHLFAGCGCLYSQRMDAVTGNVAERPVHHPLTHHTVHAGKGDTFNFNGKVRFSRPVIATMTMMFCAVVDYSKTGWRKRRRKQGFHFKLGWTFFHFRPFPYVMFFAKENHGIRPTK